MRLDNFVDRAKLQTQHIRCVLIQYSFLFDARFFNEPEYAGDMSAKQLFENPEAVVKRVKFTAKYWPADWEIVAFQHRMDLNGITVYISCDKFEPLSKAVVPAIEYLIIDNDGKCVYIG